MRIIGREPRTLGREGGGWKHGGFPPPHRSPMWGEGSRFQRCHDDDDDTKSARGWMEMEG